MGVKCSTASSWVKEIQSIQETRRHGRQSIPTRNEVERYKFLIGLADDYTPTLGWM